MVSVDFDDFVRFSDSADSILSGGIDSKIKVWDIRRKELDYEIDGHEDAVTGVSLSPDGSYLLSNSMDNSVRIFDVRPFATGNRCVKVFYGVQVWGSWSNRSSCFCLLVCFVH